LGLNQLLRKSVEQMREAEAREDAIARALYLYSIVMKDLGDMSWETTRDEVATLRENYRSTA
jgi:hypothetical protein